MSFEVEIDTDRMSGCLWGLAVGDALGAAVEFSSRGSFEPVTDFRGGGPHGLGPGEWTDDTSMALALADSIAQGLWDLNDQADRYVAWWKRGEYSVNDRCFDIGVTTQSGLIRFQKTGDAASSGDCSSRSSGNGSIMRLSPVVVRYAGLTNDDDRFLAERAEQSSLPTHGSPQCRSACRYFALILAGFLRGEARDVVLSSQWPALQRLRSFAPLHVEIDEVAAGSFRGKRPPEIEGSGYIVKSLEAALWAFHDADDFETAVLKAVNLGDDADTTGAICGQLAGAYWGLARIPDRWRKRLARPEMIEKALGGLMAARNS